MYNFDGTDAQPDAPAASSSLAKVCASTLWQPPPCMQSSVLSISPPLSSQLSRPVSFRQFHRFVASRESALRTAFHSLDVDEDGLLSAEDLQEGMTRVAIGGWEGGIGCVDVGGTLSGPGCQVGAMSECVHVPK